MADKKRSIGARVQPTVSELLLRFLRQPVEAPAASGEAVPHNLLEQPLDRQLTWNEAISAAAHFDSGLRIATEMPADWSILIDAHQHQQTTAVPFALGNYPQMVRSVQALLNKDELLPVSSSKDSSALKVPSLVQWAKGLGKNAEVPQVLLAAGVLRSAGHFDEAEALLHRLTSTGQAQWQAAHANEIAALAWHRGHTAESARLWSQQADHVPVLFNRGMAYLFLKEPAKARAPFKQAVARLPEGDGWHHLARLYLVLADMRA
jgi:tetratricopeptide (TPR) repeat protein